MSVSLVSANSVLNERIEAFVKFADERTEAYWKRQGFTFASPTRHQAKYSSDKWVKVVNLEERNGVFTETSVFAFICLQDGFTKVLGNLKVGDIHKPASWKAPAKHARGSVFAADFNHCADNGVGIEYLR